MLNILNKIDFKERNFKLRIKKIVNKDIRNELNKNKEFRSKYKNKRCFILGNGPSLKKQNLSILKDEYVFTVNQLNKSNVFYDVNSNFHVIIDHDFFEIDINKNEDSERIQTMKDLINFNIPIFVPYAEKNVLIKNGLYKENIRFIFTGGEIISDKKQFNITGFLPGAYTVVQEAIYIAIDMGFTEIYLLGCDCTGIFQQLSVEDDNEFNKYGHVYQYSKNEKEHIKKNIKKYSNNAWLNVHAKIFDIYNKLEKISLENDFKIYNSTLGGILDIFERKSIEEVLKKKSRC